MSYRCLAVTGMSLCLTFVSPFLLCQAVNADAVKVIAGTPIYVQLDRNYPMRAGQIVEAHISHPIYVGQQIALPVGTTVTGRIRHLTPAKTQRRSGRWNGDFTPFHFADVSFDQLTFPNAQSIAINTLSAGQGVQTLRIMPNSAARHSIIGTQWEAVKAEAENTVRVFTAPDKGDRLKQALWHQLPWHPERLSKASEWSFEVATPVYVPTKDSALSETTSSDKLTGARTLHAYLARQVSSTKDKAGSAVEAVVSEPLYAEDKSVEVPQGSVLEGTIVEAKAARRFGRDGKLRFAFRRIRYPEGFEQSIAGTPNGTATDRKNPLTMDSEGGVKPAPKDRVLRPLLAVFLANTALDQESSSVAPNAAASNSFGLVGRIVGAAAGSPSVAAGIGYYTAAREVYTGWIARGRDVTFEQDSRIEIAVQPRTGTSLVGAAK